MAKIVLKSPYYKPGVRIDNYVRYIATRSGVEKPEDEKLSLPATKVQENAANRPIKSYPDLKELFEYGDYIKDKTRGNAIEFIERAGEVHPELIDSMSGYTTYIATRPGAELEGGHGLFSDVGRQVILEQAARDVDFHKGNIWCHIISLRREDAARLGYDNVGAWQNLLRAQRNMIAKAMKVRPENFCWYAAFHNESHHPHVHMIAYSKDKNEPWLSKDGIMQIKSTLAKQIFRCDLLHVYERQTEYRNSIRSEAKDVAHKIVADIKSGYYQNDRVRDLLIDLSGRLSRTSGKKVYGYLKADVKAIIDMIVDEIASDERIIRLYDLWYEERENVIHTYKDKMPERVPISKNKEFKPIKNAVISEAMSLSDESLYEIPESDNENAESFNWDEVESMNAHSDEYLSFTVRGSGQDDMYMLYKKAKELLDKNCDSYDPKEAIRLLYRSAMMGYEWAQYRLGRIFVTGQIAKQNIPYGLRWLIEAEKQNNHCAQTLLGRNYLHGIYTEQDYIKAESYLEKAAMQNDAIASYSLARMHMGGLCEDSSDMEALRLLKSSADGGYEWGQYLYGKFLMQGTIVGKDSKEAGKYLRRAALPQKKQWRTDDEIPKGNMYAGYLLGKLYLFDDGISVDPKEALKWLTMSADQGYVWAQYQLGKMLLFGKFVERNTEAGLALLANAKEQGNIYAEILIENYKTNKNEISGNAAIAMLKLIGKMSSIIEKNIDTEIRKGGVSLTEGKLRREINMKKQAQGIRM
jgi:TPR repeat protein